MVEKTCKDLTLFPTLAPPPLLNFLFGFYYVSGVVPLGTNSLAVPLDTYFSQFTHFVVYTRSIAYEQSTPLGLRLEFPGIMSDKCAEACKYASTKCNALSCTTDHACSIKPQVIQRHRFASYLSDTEYRFNQC